MCRAQYGIPRSRSASGAPQKKNLSVPGRPCGQPQVLLVNSRSVLCCLTAAGADCERLRSALRRRRAGATVFALSRPVLDSSFVCGAAALPSARSRSRSRSRKTFPSTAERDIPPRRTAIAAAVAPSAQSFFNRSIRSAVHAASCNSNAQPRFGAALMAGKGLRTPARVTVCDNSPMISDSQVTVLDARQTAPNW
jgi:hypothetical protein